MPRIIHRRGKGGEPVHDDGRHNIVFCGVGEWGPGSGGGVRQPGGGLLSQFDLFMFHKLQLFLIILDRIKIDPIILS